MGVNINRVARLNTDGTRDTGYTPSTIQNAVFDTSLDVNENLYINGGFTTVSGVTVNGISKLTSGGTYDNTFIVGTGFNNFVGGSDSTVYVETSGSIMWGGIFTTYSGQTVNRILRTNPQGGSLRV